MPHIQIRLPHGTLDTEAKQALGRRLTTDVLLAEGLTDTPQQRVLCAVTFEDVQPGEWLVAGEPVDDLPYLSGFVRVSTLAGRLTDEHRTAVHRAVNEAVLDAVGGDELGGIGLWVVVEEVPDGGWGAGGTTVRSDALRELVPAAS